MTTYAQKHIDECCIAFSIFSCQKEYNYSHCMLKKGVPQSAKIISYPGQMRSGEKCGAGKYIGSHIQNIWSHETTAKYIRETLKYHITAGMSRFKGWRSFHRSLPAPLSSYAQSITRMKKNQPSHFQLRLPTASV